MMDIFEKLRTRVGCEYISDLRFCPYLEIAKKEVKNLNLSEFSEKELKDLVNYLYPEDISCCSRSELIAYLSEG